MMGKCIILGVYYEKCVVVHIIIFLMISMINGVVWTEMNKFGFLAFVLFSLETRINRGSLFFLGFNYILLIFGIFLDFI